MLRLRSSPSRARAGSGKQRRTGKRGPAAVERLLQNFEELAEDQAIALCKLMKGYINIVTPKYVMHSNYLNENSPPVVLLLLMLHLSARSEKFINQAEKACKE